MARTADTNFQPFIIRSLKSGDKTTEQLYNTAKTRKLALTRSRRRDASRPTQFAWQHQLRRDQNTLANQGVITRTLNGSWALNTY